MRRIIGAVAVATPMGAGAVAVTTGAAPSAHERVDFTGTSMFDGSTECSFLRQVFDGTLTTSRGDTLHIDGCVDFFSNPGHPRAPTRPGAVQTLARWCAYPTKRLGTPPPALQHADSGGA